MSYEDLYIVGIGASAGGFEALQKFLPKLPQNNGSISYVIAQHLDPKRPTLFGELLSKYSSFNVIPISDGEEIKSKHIYYCPPNKDVTIVEGKFRLSDPKSKSYPKPSVNKFFTSLAQEKKDKAIGIILSGTGSDGAKGISDISEYGGIALTEDEGAKYYSMPKAAIDTNKVIASLPPELLAEGIEHIIHDRKYFEKHFALQDSVQKIFDILNKKTNVDFSSYKNATISRRIKKRMSERKANGVDDYLDILQRDDDEVESLKDELLIIVTSFFRDKEAFDELKKHLEKLLEKKLDNTFRVWIAACATGEEAYTVAMILSELIEIMGSSKKVTIFATDVSEKIVMESRNRYFTLDQLDGVPEKYLNKYFDFQNNVYKPSKSLRDMIVFSKHDIIKDPPFLNLDLISCRNLLIYFDGELQKRILSIFYYAMRYDSILFLGKSETVGSLTSLYSILDNKYKIYQKSNDLAQIDLETLTYVKKNNFIVKNSKTEIENAKIVDVDSSITKAISTKYGQDGVVLDGTSYNILFYKGDCGDFIHHPKGIQTNDIFNLVADYLKPDLRVALNEAKKLKHFVSSKKIRILPKSEPKKFTIINVFPLEKNKLGDDTYFVTFENIIDRSLSLTDNDIFEPIEYDENQVSILEEELITLKERLQITIEELETSNEELQSTNEELQSTNEELQSTNEELETSNEELQSTNEELQTVNDELSFSNLDLEFVNKAFNDVLAGLDAYVMILDKKLNIIKYTDGIAKFFDISKTNDTNFSTILLNSTINLPNLLEDIKNCLNHDKSIGYDMEYNNRKYYFSIKNMDLFVDMDSKRNNKAIVLSFVDKTELIQKENLLYQQSKMASMGEMIGNIAHQWRQPLNSLNAVILKHCLVYGTGKMNDENFDDFKTKTNTIIQKMSTTIDDFRGFFSPNKQKENFSIKKVLEDVLNFMEDSFISNQIVVKNEINSDIVLRGFKNELIQVILNILNNSKDAFKIKNIETPKIVLSLEEDEKTITLSIKDNGGGIDSKILEKIFEPYFTTKFQDEGTGIGLYMSKMIIEESMGGILEIQNIDQGAIAKIKLNKEI